MNVETISEEGNEKRCRWTRYILNIEVVAGERNRRNATGRKKLNLNVETVTEEKEIRNYVDGLLDTYKLMR